MSIIQMSLITVHVRVQVTQETGEQFMKLVVSQLALALTESKDFCCHLEFAGMLVLVLRVIVAVVVIHQLDIRTCTAHCNALTTL